MPSLHKKVLERNLVKKWKVYKGDLVQCIKGKDKGKQGLVKKILRDKNRVVVEGMALVKKHVRKTKDNAGSIITKEASIAMANVAVVCPQTGKPTKIGFKFLEDGSKVRVAKISNAIVNKPAVRKRRSPPSNPFKDTTPEIVTKKSYTEAEFVELKNRFLASLELQHYNHLKQKYEHEQKHKLLAELKEREFQKDVFERAKKIVKQKIQEKALAAKE